MSADSEAGLALKRALQPFLEMAMFEGYAIVAPESHGMDDDTPLHVAAASADIGLLVALLPFVSDVDVRGDIGNTPLHEAARKGREPAARLLVARGAELDVLNDYDESPLDSMRSRPEFASLLAEMGYG